MARRGDEILELSMMRVLGFRQGGSNLEQDKNTLNVLGIVGNMVTQNNFNSILNFTC